MNLETNAHIDAVTEAALRLFTKRIEGKYNVAGLILRYFCANSLTESAEQDLIEIWSFIAADNRTAASKLVREIEAGALRPKESR